MNAGEKIKCRDCNSYAVIVLSDNRWKVVCQTCGAEYYLKEQHNK